MDVNEAPEQELPRKPELVSSGNNLLKTLLSLALYIGVYYIFFRQNLEWILLLVLVIVFHEMGHFIAMKAFGYNDVKMFFVPFLGAFVSGEPQKISQFQRAITLLAGPVPGIILGLIFFWLQSKTGNQVYHWLAFMLLVLNGINLLPVSPLDGGQLLENVFFHSNRIVQSIFIILSIIILFYAGVATRNYFLLIIIYLLIVRFRYLASIDSVRKNLESDGISYQKSYSDLSDEEYRSIRTVMIQHIRALRNVDPEYEDSDEADVGGYLKNVLTAPFESDLSNWQKLVVILVWLFSLLLPVILYLGYAYKNLTIV
ncbi:MAG: hypothetical protein C5B52_04010 [Bacteroidetes bacterium]|nr:MAG: hypothetical protein C5B52_04010 [Bacteroidota bacterium]